MHSFKINISRRPLRKGTVVLFCLRPRELWYPRLFNCVRNQHVCFSCYFPLTQTSLYLLPKRLFLWGYCPLDTKSWHLWILEERKSKMVLRSILKIIYCYFRVCFALPNVFWQSVFLQHCLAVKGVKESSLGCCARQEL